MKAPGAILWFSQLYLGSMLASLVVMIATWEVMVKDLPRDDIGELVRYSVIAFVGLCYALSLGLWWYIMRRRSRTARTVLTVLTVLGVIAVAFGIAQPYLDSTIDPDQRAIGWQIAENTAVVVGLVANALLFAPGAQRWFTRDPEFSDVFS